MTAVANVLSSPQNDGYHYMLVMRHILNGYKTGLCLWRSDNLSDPLSWRGWNGSISNMSDFTVQSIDPYYNYTESDIDPSDHVCAILPSLSNDIRFSWTYNTVIEGYIGVGLADKVKFPDNTISDAVMYSVSKDMFEWTEPVPFLKINASADTPDNTTHEMYPSLIDETSAGFNYEYTGQFPYLYLTMDYPETQQYGDRRRDIVRIKLNITKA